MYQVIYELNNEYQGQQFFNDLTVAQNCAREALNHGYDHSEIYDDNGFVEEFNK